MLEKFRDLWEKGVDAKDIAKILKVSLPTVYRTRERLMLEPRPREEYETDDPSPSEIENIKLMFRESWTTEERFKRWVGGPPRS